MVVSGFGGSTTLLTGSQSSVSAVSRKGAGRGVEGTDSHDADPSSAEHSIPFRTACTACG